jgi:D-glycero-alpha-D-manno-heptose-7-phosphate kinase
MIISRTPYRISFFGGGTDFPAWYKTNSGAVLSTTIDKYCYITIRYLPPFFEHKHRIVYSKIESVRKISQIRHPVVKALLDYYRVKKGVEVHHDGDLPARSGIGSSSSFTVGMLNCLSALQGRIISKDDLAKQAIMVEQKLLKEHVGCQDQIAVAYGGFNKINFSYDSHFRIIPMSLSPLRIKHLQDHLMLFFTGVSRFSSDIAAEQVKNTGDRKTELKEMFAMVDEAVNILNCGRNLRDFGKLLNESWKLKKSLSSLVSTPAIDGIYCRAVRAGALGGKILGAGGGGFILFFVPPEKQESLRKKLKGLIEVKFSFEREGSQIVYYNPSTG